MQAGVEGMEGIEGRESTVALLEEAVTRIAGELGATALPRPLSAYDDPLAELRGLRASLPPGGRVVCGTLNAATSDALVQLLRSDPAQPGSYEASAPQHLHGYATAYKLLLEAGFSADIVETVSAPVDPGLLEAAAPLMQHLGVDTERAARHLGAAAYVLVADVVADVAADLAVPVAEQRPVTFVACVNDDLQLANNLLASPVLGAGSPHQLLTYRGMTSAAEGLNRGLHDAEHDLVVFIQQDIFIPSWWPARLQRQWELASADTPPSLAGPFGVRYREGGREHVGHAVDRDHLLRMERPLPAPVDGLDELVLIVPRDTDLRVEPRVGWHLYGTDLALQVHRAGGWTAVLDLPCHHNSLYHDLDDGYHHSEAVLAGIWPAELPIVTNTSSIVEDPRDRRVRDLEDFIQQRGEEFTTMVDSLEVAQAEIDRLNEHIGTLNEQIVRVRERNQKLRSRLDETGD
ncbi:putative glycosyltransferase-like protein [metagenome]|uniref:Putative glycosyltransferase-like protein n=1 Tax=metagenome TaxID=256318 RepID=A0A2P2CFY9_9ZZZZ